MTGADRSGEAQGRDRILAIADSLVDDHDVAAEETESPEGWISFALAGQGFALPVSHIRGVHRAGHITPLPRAPRSVRGLTNLRGRVIAVVDLATQLDLDATKIGSVSRILDAEIGRRRLGLLVERTESLIKIRPDDIEPVEEETASLVARRAAGVVKTKSGRVVLLDPEQILDDAHDPPRGGAVAKREQP